MLETGKRTGSRPTQASSNDALHSIVLTFAINQPRSNPLPIAPSSSINIRWWWWWWICCHPPCRLLWDEPLGGPSEAGDGSGPGHGGALHPAVQQPPEEVGGAHGQHLPHPGHAQPGVRLGVFSCQQDQHLGQLLPDPDGTWRLLPHPPCTRFLLTAKL